MIDLTNHNWRPFSQEKCKALNIWPNQLWRNGRDGALVVFKSQNYEEYALSKVGLDYVAGADQAQRIIGFVVLAHWQGSKLLTVASKPVAAVVAALNGITPRDGRFGPYWWMQADLTPDAHEEAF